jgi:hypothetical protein
MRARACADANQLRQTLPVNRAARPWPPRLHRPNRFRYVPLEAWTRASFTATISAIFSGAKPSNPPFWVTFRVGDVVRMRMKCNCDDPVCPGDCVGSEDEHAVDNVTSTHVYVPGAGFRLDRPDDLPLLVREADPPTPIDAPAVAFHLSRWLDRGSLRHTRALPNAIAGDDCSIGRSSITASHTTCHTNAT